MTSHGFITLTSGVLGPCLAKLGFTVDPPKLSGRECSATFSSERHVVQVSFEPGDGMLLVLLRTRTQEGLSEFDDVRASPRLADLNTRYMPRVTHEERKAVEQATSTFKAEDRDELLLLKAVKELCLVLPHHLAGA